MSPGVVSRALTFPLIALVRLYQVTLSPFLGGQCRYHPTCSAYAITALRDYGPWRGSWMSLRRIGRCHPFAKGGYDPVPPPTTPQSGPFCNADERE